MYPHQLGHKAQLRKISIGDRVRLQHVRFRVLVILLACCHRGRPCRNHDSCFCSDPFGGICDMSVRAQNSGSRSRSANLQAFVAWVVGGEKCLEVIGKLQPLTLVSSLIRAVVW